MQLYNERFDVLAVGAQDLNRPLRTTTPRLNDNPRLRTFPPHDAALILTVLSSANRPKHKRRSVHSALG